MRKGTQCNIDEEGRSGWSEGTFATCKNKMARAEINEPNQS